MNMTKNMIYGTIIFVFVCYSVSRLGMATHGEYAELLLVPIIAFLLLLYLHMRHLTTQGIDYDKGWKSSLIYAFLLGLMVPITEVAIGLRTSVTGFLLSAAGYCYLTSFVGFIFINFFYRRNQK